MPFICAPKPALHTQGELRPHEIIEVPGREDRPLGTEVHEDGIVADVSFPQPSKAKIPIEVTEAGIVTDIRELHLSKALLPMEVTEVGMLTVLRAVH